MMEFSALTYNIHKGIGNDRKFRLNRTTEVLLSANADFYLLQEVDSFVPRSGNQDTALVLAGELGFHHATGLNVKLKKGNYGNTTLSRYPISESYNFSLTWGIKKARGCLVSRIKTPQGDLMVLNYHLGLAGIERTWQIKKLISHIQENFKNIPILVSGDSNDRNHRLTRLFAEAGFNDTCTTGKMFTYPAYAPIWRLDKAFVNNAIGITEHMVIKNKLTRMASDHLPVQVKFEINPSNTLS